MLISAPRKRGAKAAALDRLAAFEDAAFVTYEEGDYVFGRWFEANFSDQPASVRSVAHFSELEEIINQVYMVVRSGSVVRREVQELATTLERLGSHASGT